MECNIINSNKQMMNDEWFMFMALKSKRQQLIHDLY